MNAISDFKRIITTFKKVILVKLCRVIKAKLYPVKREIKLLLILYSYIFSNYCLLTSQENIGLLSLIISISSRLGDVKEACNIQTFC